MIDEKRYTDRWLDGFVAIIWLTVIAMALLLVNIALRGNNIAMIVIFFIGLTIGTLTVPYLIGEIIERGRNNIQRWM